MPTTAVTAIDPPHLHTSAGPVQAARIVDPPVQRTISMAMSKSKGPPRAVSAVASLIVDIVEEMALAAGLTRPAPMVLARDASINAFAAGNSPQDAAVGITRGALLNLTRDELQGVIAHEFSHIGNGDMKLNLRIIGAIAGLTFAAAATAGGVIDWPTANAGPVAGFTGRLSPDNGGAGLAFAPPQGAPLSFADIFEQVAPAVVQSQDVRVLPGGTAVPPSVGRPLIPPAMTEYMGRTIAPAMSYHGGGAGWLLRKLREEEEKPSVLLPELRLGYAILPPSIIEAVIRAKQLTDLHASTLPQWALAKFIAEGGKVYAENFDGVGLVNDIQRNLGVSLAGKRVLICGAGGATRGAILPIAAQKPALIAIANRSADKAHGLKADFSAQVALQTGGYEDLAGESFDVVLNATSTGLSQAALPLPTGVFAPGALAYELVYGKGLTPFLKQAQAAGVTRIADGVGMLVEQAAEAFEWWRGVRPDTQPVIARFTIPLV